MKLILAAIILSQHLFAVDAPKPKPPADTIVSINGENTIAVYNWDKNTISYKKGFNDLDVIHQLILDLSKANQAVAACNEKLNPVKK